MSDFKRIANYRSGDRAESLGVVLMQAFCAVTAVPRQEDFGVFDAIATLLRHERRMLYAEDSFLVQFKSRTVESVEFIGPRFEALLDQELSLFLAQIDLTSAGWHWHHASAFPPDDSPVNERFLLRLVGNDRTPASVATRATPLENADWEVALPGSPPRSLNTGKMPVPPAKCGLQNGPE